MPQPSLAEKVNLNTCNAKDLAKAAGISALTANEIIAWRKNHGDFVSADDIKNVPRITPAMLDKILPHVKV